MVDDDVVLGIAAYVEDDANLPDLADLPGWLQRHPPERPELAEFTIGCYIAASERCPWAWEGLVRLLKDTRGREPEVLQRWACDVASERRQKPTKKSRSTPRKDDRNLRLYIAYLMLGADGEARKTLETALGLEESTIRKNLPKPAANSVGTQILRELLTGR